MGSSNSALNQDILRMGICRILHLGCEQDKYNDINLRSLWAR